MGQTARWTGLWQDKGSGLVPEGTSPLKGAEIGSYGVRVGNSGSTS